MHRPLRLLLAGLAFDACAGLAIYAYWLPPAPAQTLAAWVQAFGSIVAIAVAYLVGAKQSRASIEAVEATQRAEVENRRRGLFAVVQSAFAQAEAIRPIMAQEVPREGLYGVYDRVVTQRIAKSLESLPLYEVGAKGGVAAIQSMRDQFLFLEDALETYIAGPWKHPVIKETLEQYPLPEDRPVLDRALDRSNKVLISNVLVHLNRITSDYHAVRAAMFPGDYQA